jgi:hypothetical protein
VLVRAAEREHHHVHEVREWPIYVAHVAVVHFAVSERPGDVLENPLIASERRDRRAVRGVDHPEEGHDRDEHGQEHRSPRDDEIARPRRRAESEDDAREATGRRRPLRRLRVRLRGHDQASQPRPGVRARTSARDDGR